MTRFGPLPYALAMLLIGGGAWYSSVRAERDGARHAPSAERAALPVLSLSRQEADAITRIELLQPDGDESESAITLEKTADSWQLSVPLVTPASVPKVRALVENLSALRLTDAIDSSTALYEPYGLSEAKAFHVRVYAGARKLRDLYFGKSSARGQLLRIGQQPGVFSIDGSGPGSYAGYLYTRPLRSWRESRLLDFDEARVVEVRIENPHGAFRFVRAGNGWSAARWPRSRDGQLAAKASSYVGFDENKVNDLLRAFRQLSADEFGQEADRASSGLDRPEQTGGVITIQLDDHQAWTIGVGTRASGPSAWAIKDSRWAVKAGADKTLYALALWTTDWITRGPERFEHSGAPGLPTRPAVKP